MKIEHAVSLEKLNTFGVKSIARYYTLAHTASDIREALSWAKKQGTKVVILGGGSNVLLTSDIDALVIHVGVKGISLQQLNETQHLVTAGAGEVWHDLVLWTLERNLGGIENLTFIPGAVGAAPVQNIGAYGVEFGDICQSVTALNRSTGEERVFLAEECRFGYRSSIFKQQPEQWIVLDVSLRLDKAAPLKTGYGAIKSELVKRGLPSVSYGDVAQVVENIRREKLPSPEELGSAGSFFKNPVVEEFMARQLLAKYPELPVYPQQNGTVKLSAAWLLDQAGWKGKKNGFVGCYASQPLVLVNYGTAKGRDILDFSQAIQQDIARLFGITLEREVVVYP